jgi:hypothetical protein
MIFSSTSLDYGFKISMHGAPSRAKNQSQPKVTKVHEGGLSHFFSCAGFVDFGFAVAFGVAVGI